MPLCKLYRKSSSFARSTPSALLLKIARKRSTRTIARLVWPLKSGVLPLEYQKSSKTYQHELSKMMNFFPDRESSCKSGGAVRLPAMSRQSFTQQRANYATKDEQPNHNEMPNTDKLSVSVFKKRFTVKQASMTRQAFA